MRSSEGHRDSKGYSSKLIAKDKLKGKLGAVENMEVYSARKHENTDSMLLAD